MDMTSFAMWFAIALVLITVVTSKVITKRSVSDPVCSRPLPPVVDGVSVIGVLYVLLTKGFRAMIHNLYTKLGSVFTISIFGLKVTFLVGPEILDHFFHGFESEISRGKSMEFSVPMAGKAVGYGVDSATRMEQNRMRNEALRASRLRFHVDPMLQEVKDYFEKWGQQGTADLKQELEQLLMLISARCLLGKEVREKMLDEVLALFQELFDNSVCLTSVLFPYLPTPASRRRDAAHQKLSELFTEVVRSRKSSNRVEDDVLQTLIDSKYKDGHPMTEAEVIGLIITLIFGGKHTSSISAAWTGAHLLSNSDWLGAAIEEQDSIITKFRDRIHYDVLQEMDILHRCIKEALRMHPPGAMILRSVYKDFTVRTKEGVEFVIPGGHHLASPFLYNNYNPCIYKDPGVYDPHRFGPGREEDRVGGKFSYTSFGAGRFACAGEAFAYVQLKVIWSHLLRNFELKLVSPFPEANWFNLVPEPKGKLMVSYKRRQQPPST